MSNTYGSCPLGGLWYTCTAQSPTFFGCCTSDPCNGIGCPGSDLRAAGLGIGIGPNPATNPNTSYWPNVDCSNGKWWTCADQAPTFQGCCISDPCSGDGGTCAMGNLFPAAFNSVSSISTLTSTSISTPTPASTSTSSPASTSVVVSTRTTVINGQTTAAVVTSSPTSVAALPGVSSTSTTNLPLIVGAAVGGAVGGIAIIALLAFLCRRYLKNRDNAVSSDSPRPGDPFLAKGPDTPQTPFNDESYYPGQNTYGVPPGQKVPFPHTTEMNSPAPPSYHSPQLQAGYSKRNTAISEMDSTNMNMHSPVQTQESFNGSGNRNTQMSEIDSVGVYELGGGVDDGVRRGDNISPRGGGGHGLGLGRSVG